MELRGGGRCNAGWVLPTVAGCCWVLPLCFRGASRGPLGGGSPESTSNGVWCGLIFDWPTLIPDESSVGIRSRRYCGKQAGLLLVWLGLACCQLLLHCLLSPACLSRLLSPACFSLLASHCRRCALAVSIGPSTCRYLGTVTSYQQPSLPLPLPLPRPPMLASRLLYCTFMLDCANHCFPPHPPDESCRLTWTICHLSRE